MARAADSRSGPGESKESMPWEPAAERAPSGEISIPSTRPADRRASGCPPRIDHERSELGVECESAQVESRLEQRTHQRLGVVERLRYRRVSKSLREWSETLEGDKRRTGCGRHHDPNEVVALPHRVEGDESASDGCERIGTRAGDHVDGDDLVFRGGGSTDLLESLPERSKGEFVEDPPYLLGVPGPQPHLLRVGVDGHVLDEPRQITIEKYLLARCGQALPQLGRLFFQVVVDTLEAPVPGDEARCGFSPHPGNSGQVVG